MENTALTRPADDGLVSVIVPCYQQEQFIGDALQSVSDQSYQNWECIVVDDGSSDSSKEIILKFVELDNRMHYVYQKNSGVSTARNNGFQNAHGEFICFLDGDDLIRPEKIRRQIDYLEEHPEVDVAYCDHIHRFHEKGIDEHYDSSQLGHEPLEDFLFSWDRGLSIPLHCGMFRRSIWESDELPFVTEYQARWEDWIFWIDLCIRKCRFSYLHYQDAIYRIHSSNFTGDAQNKAENAIRAAFYVASRLPEEYRDRFLSETIAHYMKCFSDWRMNEALRKSELWKILGLASKPFNLFMGTKWRARMKKYLIGSS